MKPVARILVVLTACALWLTSCDAAANRSDSDETATYASLMQDVLINADYWEDEPRILGAGLGFTNINGVPFFDSAPESTAEAIVRAAGGPWNKLDCGETTPAIADHTSAATPQQVAIAFGKPAFFAAGFPVEFSWPVLLSSVDAGDFDVTLNNGSVVKPVVASGYPNFEYNERSTIVLFGQFGNRYDPGADPDKALYPVSLEIVDDDTPLMLAGPGGRTQSAVGMSFGAPGDALTAYKAGNGPTLVAAKLSKMSTKGEGAPSAFSGDLPNDGVALYGDEAQYRLRMLTSGGFSPDGVLGMLPTEFGRYFRIRLETDAGDEMWISDTNEHDVDGHAIRVVGLADLGLAAGGDVVYDDCYGEDGDNQIDIVLAGDEAAMRLVTHIEIPAAAPLDVLYNPGGPGNDPTPGVTYSNPTPYELQEVTIALDDPKTVTYP